MSRPASTEVGQAGGPGNRRDPLTRAAVDVGAVRHRPPVSQWLPTVLLTIALLGLVVYAANNPRFEWDVVAKYFFAPQILQGLALTIALGVLCTAIGIVIGTLVAIMRSADFAPLRWFAMAYTGFFRAIPPLVQLLFWYNLAYLQPFIRIELPWLGTIFDARTNDIVTPLLAAVIGLSLHEGAYQSEIMRAGFLSVPAGQREAARALGLGAATIFFRVTLPQALVAIIPPTGSNLVGTMKAISLVSVLGLTDLLHSAEIIYGQTYEVVPLLIVVCAWYVIVVSLLQFVQGHVESYVQRGLRLTTNSGRTIAKKRRKEGSK